MSLNGMQDLERVSSTISDTHLFPPWWGKTPRGFLSTTQESNQAQDQT